MSLQTLEDIKIDRVDFSQTGSIYNQNENNLTVSAGSATASLTLESGSGGISLDSTKGEGVSGSVAGPINLISQEESSWINTASDLIIKTLESGNIVLSAADSVNLVSEKVSIGTKTSTTDIYGKLHLAGSDSYVTHVDEWKDGEYVTNDEFKGGSLNIGGGFGVAGNIIIANDNDNGDTPSLNVKQIDLNGENVVSLTQVNTSSGFFDFVSKSKNMGSGRFPDHHDPDGSLVSSIKNKNISKGKLTGYIKIKITDHSTESGKIEDGFYALPFYDLK
jgi:hypothetical protein